TLSVLDNGKVYDPDANGTGTGVQGMKERVRAVDGTLEYGPRTPYGWKGVDRVPCTAASESGRCPNKRFASCSVMISPCSVPVWPPYCPLSPVSKSWGKPPTVTKH